eukprot:364599-Chlamydomonas_euryale.AAC.12
MQFRRRMQWTVHAVSPPHAVDSACSPAAACSGQCVQSRRRTQQTVYVSPQSIRSSQPACRLRGWVARNPGDAGWASPGASDAWLTWHTPPHGHVGHVCPARGVRAHDVCPAAGVKAQDVCPAGGVKAQDECPAGGVVPCSRCESTRCMPCSRCESTRCVKAQDVCHARGVKAHDVCPAGGVKAQDV